MGVIIINARHLGFYTELSSVTEMVDAGRFDNHRQVMWAFCYLDGERLRDSVSDKPISYILLH